MSDKIEGCPVSIQWDKEVYEDWIVIKNAEGILIMKVQKQLWDFSIEFRDSIMCTVRRLYG